jgi:hypothetical protein
LTKTNTLTRWIFVSDTHGDREDPAAMEAMYEFLNWWKPTVRIAGGDHGDFRSLREKASENERQESCEEDVAAMCRFFERYRPTVWTKGNHDDRVYRVIDDPRTKGTLRDACRAFARRIESSLPESCIRLPYALRRGAHRMGQMHFTHGYAHGKSAALDMVRTFGTSVVFGDLHRCEETPADDINGSIGMCAGCLCQLDMDYAKNTRGALRWSHGFVYGVMDAHGNHHAWFARPRGGTCLLPHQAITTTTASPKTTARVLKPARPRTSTSPTPRSGSRTPTRSTSRSTRS